MRHWSWSKPTLIVGILCLPTLTSCLFGPTGTNTATGIYPSPAGGKISLTYTPTSTSVQKVAFTVEGVDGVTIPPDDSPDDGFTAVVDTSQLTPGLYVVDATEDDGSTPNGHLALLVPSGAGGASGAASPGATGGASPAATPDTGASNTGASGAATTDQGGSGAAAYKAPRQK